MEAPSPTSLRSGSGSRRAARRSAVFAPLYRQIKDLLVESLRQGEWMPGAAIPSETELATRFQVSQGTVRKAIDELASENLLIRRQGKGTFVATHQEPKAQFRFLRLAPDGGQPVAAHSRFLECSRIRANGEIAARLGLRAGAPLIHVRRVLLFGDRPRVLDDIWLPAVAFRNLSAELLAQYTGPLYGLFEREFGVRMIRAEEQLRAVAASAEDAEALQIAPGSPLLRIDRVAFTYGDRPIEFRRGHCVTNDFHYWNRLM
ncbi:MAG TPA: GntR family transcriptional regulator [Burkholderiaceae bacterium]|jgi:GntR family transcriptional regulator|nr:GntR family transcriptional regulator [Burkholderiaceae bacterium]